MFAKQIYELTYQSANQDCSLPFTFYCLPAATFVTAAEAGIIETQ
jgi:hypothetical protein